MKTIILFLSLLISFVTLSRTIPNSCTKEEKQFVKQLLKQENQHLVGILKGPNTDYKIFIEFTTKIYILDGTYIEEVWVLDNADWQELPFIEEDNSLKSRSLPSIIYSFDEGKQGQRIEIQPINGTNPWTIYYQDSFYDPTINATIYYNDDIKIIIGEDFASYEDSLDTWWFSIPACNENVVSN